MDSLSAGSPDPETLRYLEAAINELRELSAGVASAEGVASLAGDVQALSARIDHIAETTGATGLDLLAHRVNELTQALDTRVEQIGPLPQNLEALVQVADRQAQRLRLGGARSGRVRAAGTADPRASPTSIEAADHRSGDLARDRARHPATDLAGARGARGGGCDRRARGAHGRGRHGRRGATGADVSALKRDLETLHAHHVESEQRTHETLEAVHETLERLVERLATVETGAPTAPHAYTPPHAAASRQHRRMPQVYAPPVQPVEPPPMPEARRTRALRRASPRPPCRARATPFVHVQRTERPPIDPDLPADTPLEPGSAGRGARPPSASPPPRQRSRPHQARARPGNYRQGEFHRRRAARRAGRRQ